MKFEGERIKIRRTLKKLISSMKLEIWRMFEPLMKVHTFVTRKYERYLANKVFWKEVESKLEKWEDW